jgi:CheY-like chemotaxis protein
MARILLADDEQSTRDLVTRALGSEGHSIETVEDGQQALDRLLVAPASFDLLITDVQMPALDGVALATRARTAAPRLRIVLMSGFAVAPDKVASIPGPVPRVVTKPFTLEQIRTEIRSALA